MTATSSIPSSGQNILNFSTIDSSGNVSNTKNSVAVTFNDSTHFTIGGKNIPMILLGVITVQNK